jgi:hypothetical protein
MRRALLLIIALNAGSAHAKWVVSDRGECVRGWTSDSLLRGPTAMLNAPLLPVRTLVGGAQMANEDRVPGLRRKILLTPLLSVGGLVMGFVESGIWLGTGLVDTVSGGYFGVAPDEATVLSASPVRPAFVSPSVGAREPTTDRCGRPRS